MAALLAEFAVEWLLDHGKLSSGLRLITLLPLIPVVLFAVSLTQVIGKMDELQKRICLESVAIAFVLTLLLNFLLRSLAQAGMRVAQIEDLGTSMIILWGGAYLFTSWRYR